jgi:tetratricopeptide (TPR) repeat protein
MSEPQTSPDQIFIEQLEKMLQQARDRADTPAIIPALANLGKAYLDAGSAPKALTQFEEGIELAEQTGDQEAQTRLWGVKGMALEKLGNFHFAQLALLKSHKLAKTIDHKPLIIDTFIQLGSLQAEMGQPTKAISQLEQAYGLALTQSDKVRQMLVASRLGALFLGMEAPEKAAEYFAGALHAAQALKNGRAECLYNLNLGQVYLANAELDLANEHFEEALNLAGVLEDPQAEINALNHLLRLNIVAVKPSLAILYGDYVIRLARGHNDPLAELSTINMLVSFLLSQAQFKRALPYLDRGQTIAEISGDWDWQLAMLTQRGDAHYQLEQFDPALADYGHALELAAQLHNQPVEAQLLGRLGAVQAEAGQLAAAAEFADKSLALAVELDDQRLQGEQHMLLAFTFNDLNQPESARNHCHQAIELYQLLGEIDLTEQAQTLLNVL